MLTNSADGHRSCTGTGAGDCFGESIEVRLPEVMSVAREDLEVVVQRVRETRNYAESIIVFDAQPACNVEHVLRTVVDETFGSDVDDFAIAVGVTGEIIGCARSGVGTRGPMDLSRLA